jgi:hypothetical protein
VWALPDPVAVRVGGPLARIQLGRSLGSPAYFRASRRPARAMRPRSRPSTGAPRLIDADRDQRRPQSAVYFRHHEETARQAKVLTRDETRRMAVNFARLPSC